MTGKACRQRLLKPSGPRPGALKPLVLTLYQPKNRAFAATIVGNPAGPEGTRSGPFF
jgi:hypothetical protein